MFPYHVSHEEDFWVDLSNVEGIVNGFEGTKVHTVYEVNIAWAMNDNKYHSLWVEIINSLYFPNGHERLVSPK